jgi:hypothetical protein
MRTKALCCLVTLLMALGVEAYDASSIPVAISAIVSDLDTDLSTIQAALVLFSVICAPLMLKAGTLGSQSFGTNQPD